MSRHKLSKRGGSIERLLYKRRGKKGFLSSNQVASGESLQFLTFSFLFPFHFSVSHFSAVPFFLTLFLRLLGLHYASPLTQLHFLHLE